MSESNLILGDCFEEIPKLSDESIDLVLTDFPYGISFMGKDWDSVEESFYYKIGKVLFPKMKAGSFLVSTFTPRQDMLWRCLSELEKAGFEMKTSPMFWLYHTGFPKALDVSKGIDKRKDWNLLKKLQKNIKIHRLKLSISQNEAARICGIIKNDESLGGGGYMWFETGLRLPSKEEYFKLKKGLNLNNQCDLAFEEAEREIVGEKIHSRKEQGWAEQIKGGMFVSGERKEIISNPINEVSKQWAGFKSFQLKPAVEIILVVQKPKNQKTIVGQVLENGCGAVNIEACRIPFANENNTHGRFPANLLVSDEALISKSDGAFALVKSGQKGFGGEIYGKYETSGDDGKTFYSDKEKNKSANRFYSLDAWALKRNITLTQDSAFFDVPKPSKSEKNKGLEEFEEKNVRYEDNSSNSLEIFSNQYTENSKNPQNRGKTPKHKNNHPTCKPVKLFSYLTEMFSKKNDTVLDCFMGSGTTGIACSMLNRNFIGIEKEKDYFEIAKARIEEYSKQTKLSGNEVSEKQ